MIETYVVQINSNGKWKSAYRGDDVDLVQNVHDASITEYGSEAVRILKSNGKKEDGSIRWVIAKMPKEPEPELPVSEKVSLDHKNTKNKPPHFVKQKKTKPKYTILNIHKIKDPEDSGGFSKLTFWVLIVIGGFLLPIIGLVVGFWKRKDATLVKQVQAKAILAISSLFIGIHLISALIDISNTTVGDKSNAEIVAQASNDDVNIKSKNTAWQRVSASPIIGYWTGEDSCTEFLHSYQKKEYTMIANRESMRSNGQPPMVIKLTPTYFQKGNDYIVHKIGGEGIGGPTGFQMLNHDTIVYADLYRSNGAKIEYPNLDLAVDNISSLTMKHKKPEKGNTLRRCSSSEGAAMITSVSSTKENLYRGRARQADNILNIDEYMTVYSAMELSMMNSNCKVLSNDQKFNLTRKMVSLHADFGDWIGSDYKLLGWVAKDAAKEIPCTYELKQEIRSRYNLSQRQGLYIFHTEAQKSRSKKILRNLYRNLYSSLSEEKLTRIATPAVYIMGNIETKDLPASNALKATFESQLFKGLMNKISEYIRQNVRDPSSVVYHRQTFTVLHYGQEPWIEGKVYFSSNELSHNRKPSMFKVSYDAQGQLTRFKMVSANNMSYVDYDYIIEYMQKNPRARYTWKN